jgi:hypothetical protein
MGFALQGAGQHMKWFPPGFGDERASAEDIKRDGWREQGILVVAIADSRLNWTEKELLCRIGEKLYGRIDISPSDRERDND